MKIEQTPFWVEPIPVVDAPGVYLVPDFSWDAVKWDPNKTDDVDQAFKQLFESKVLLDEEGEPLASGVIAKLPLLKKTLLLRAVMSTVYMLGVVPSLGKPEAGTPT